MGVAMPKIDLGAIAAVSRTGYPAPYASAVAGRYSQRLTRAAGLTDFGVNIITLEPGAWSSQRHWHETEDEFVIMLEGEAILVDDSGRPPLKPGDFSSFPKNDGNGDNLVNGSAADERYLVVGATGFPGQAQYPDIDLFVDGSDGG